MPRRNGSDKGAGELDNFFQRYIDSWRFNGWFIHDIFLGIVIGVGLLLLLYALFKRRLNFALVITFILYTFLGIF